MIPSTTSGLPEASEIVWNEFLNNSKIKFWVVLISSTTLFFSSTVSLQLLNSLRSFEYSFLTSALGFFLLNSSANELKWLE
ncbi:hypothetical protein [Mycoplasma crocodyli]|uniref:hypothetical protein n=1 Tax=Mycoplasma crocodyli TaxID=50052 RepID=UPI0005A2C2C5|nr:hypothetical protein [Mycoplasma crocodyli]